MDRLWRRQAVREDGDSLPLMDVYARVHVRARDGYNRSAFPILPPPGWLGRGRAAEGGWSVPEKPARGLDRCRLIRRIFVAYESFGYGWEAVRSVRPSVVRS